MENEMNLNKSQKSSSIYAVKGKSFRLSKKKKQKTKTQTSSLQKNIDFERGKKKKIKNIL